ncbi:MAG: class I SAM-dependent methyltransferase [Candidatus Aminicenantes bacterium]|nr:class I SAM-dependent methyltransferase [Candidatus Aminicenantes bacterium]
MRRTLEKLAREREEKEEAFSRKLDEIKQKIKTPLPSAKFPRFKKRRSEAYSPSGLLADIVELFELERALADARDREWDALGSNHVGIIFKSMEWRVDKLAAEYADVKALMKSFLLLREKLAQLLTTLEQKKSPEAAAVREILAPLEDWHYAGFENRFRGSEDEVKKQLSPYVSYFPEGGKVADLGCGRGEFLELLRQNGVDAEGVDSNSQMVEACLDKGLRCHKGDLLEWLEGRPDGSLDGIFSSQVIEHLEPSTLKKLVETGYKKLAPSGIFILETINPASVFALVEIYFLDLSHQRPIHPRALQFLLEATGFEDVEIKYAETLEREKLETLPGTDGLAVSLNQNLDRLNALLYAPPNYAAIARRK